ncbi:site-specific DNA-methyltransferase [Thalassolituus sp. LLYu03]|uniref:site-specific DNA-methyltransferase n=1 Tax=Thalassolituus sp. LLYu03 TaxID=3421656 RepID=UPI003D26F8C0
MKKLKMHSPNLTQENIARIRDLFPGCVTEAKGEDGSVKLAVDFDQLRQELSESIVEGPQERYHLNWPGKREALLAANAPIAKTLRPCREESVDFDTTKNLFIEGDNLEALKLLQETYLGRVKMIYIDPPYNTGKDFIYEDDFSETTEEFLKKSNQKDEQDNRLVSNAESNGRFHSDWLSMIYPRLKLARNLLRDDGVIFISIDDNEVANLKRVCDEIYGAHNFVGILSVENNPKGRKNSAFISVSSEYCMIYAKSKNDTFFVENIPKKSTDMTIDEDGNFVHGSGKRVLVGENSFNTPVSKIESEKNYSVYYRSSDRGLVIKKEEFGETDSQLIDDGYTKYFSHYCGCLIENTYSEGKFYELFQNRALEFSSDKIYEKNFSDTIRIKSQLTNREYEAIVQGVKQKYSMELTTTGAGTYIKKLFNISDTPFSSPKNIGFIKILVSLFKSEDFIVLDFFSGSSTTADAVMRLNAEDGANRKFIMVQLPESLDENLEKAVSVQEKQTIKSAISICDSIKKPHLLTEISKERIRLAGKKILEEGSAKGWSRDTGFRVLKVDTSNMADVYYSPDSLNNTELDLFVDNIKPERTAEDLLFHVMLDWGVDLALPISKQSIQGKDVFLVDGNSLVACFDASGSIDEAFVKELAKHEPLRVVFRDAGFKDSSVKINVEQIFKLLSPITEVKCI